MRTSLRSAAVGFIVTAGVFGTVFLVAYLLAPMLSDNVIGSREYGTPQALEEDRRWVVFGMQSLLRAAIVMLWPVFGVYWMLAGLLGKGRVARAKVANWVFVAGCAAMSLDIANSYFLWAETYCDQLPYPHEGFQLMRIHECPSSGMFFSGLSLTSFVLLLVSLVVRIAETRKSPH